MDPNMQQMIGELHHAVGTLNHSHLQQHMVQSEQQNTALQQQLAGIVGNTQGQKSPYDKIASGIKPPAYSGDKGEALELSGSA